MRKVPLPSSTSPGIRRCIAGRRVRDIGSVETGRGWMREVSPRRKKKGAAGVGTIQPFKGRALKFFNSNITTDDTSPPFFSTLLLVERYYCVIPCTRTGTRGYLKYYARISNREKQSRIINNRWDV